MASFNLFCNLTHESGELVDALLSPEIEKYEFDIFIFFSISAIETTLIYLEILGWRIQTLVHITPTK